MAAGRRSRAILRPQRPRDTQLQRCVLKFGWDLVWSSPESSDGKNLGKFGGRAFYMASKALEISVRISGQISQKISEISFRVSHLFAEALFSRRAMIAFSNQVPGRSWETVIFIHLQCWEALPFCRFPAPAVYKNPVSQGHRIFIHRWRWKRQKGSTSQHWRCIKMSLLVLLPYYEARHDYTNNSETIFCVTDVCVIGNWIPRQFFFCVIGFTVNTTWRRPNYTKEFLPESSV